VKNFISSILTLLILITCAQSYAQVELFLEEIPGITNNKKYIDYKQLAATVSPSEDRMIVQYWSKETSSYKFIEFIKIDTVWQEKGPLTLINAVGNAVGFGAPSFNADGTAIYFDGTYSDSYGRSDIYSSTLINGVWQSPVNIGPPINDDGSQDCPWISPDGQRLYFNLYKVSKEEKTYKIHYSQKNGNGAWTPKKIWFENLKFKSTSFPVVFRDNALIFSARKNKKKEFNYYISVMSGEDTWSVPVLIKYNRDQLAMINKEGGSPFPLTTTSKFDYIYASYSGKIYRSKVHPTLTALVDHAYQPKIKEERIVQVTVANEEQLIAPQENRTALVIGNGAYLESKLRNPVNDAQRITTELKQAGFNVITLTDVNLEGMKEAIRQFGDELRSKPGVGLFYYAGHGLQNDGINYLVPTDANIQRQYDIEDECMRADRVLRMMELYGNPMNIVILDACRNNPFFSKFRSLEKGLAQPETAPTGSIIAFATAPGKTASDGDGENGLYTEELIKAIRIPGIKIEEIFKRVRIGVQEKTGGLQSPWENSSLVGDFYFYKK
jgi:hypothetical protein